MNQMEERKKVRPKLWKLTYSDYNAGVHLTTYADTIVFDSDGNKKILAATRFGGYAEQVRGMADAIYGGGTVKLETENETVEFQSLVKRYRRNVANDEIYTEATLLIADDRLEAEGENSNNEAGNDKQQASTNDTHRTSYIFCEKKYILKLLKMLKIQLLLKILLWLRKMMRSTEISK